MEQDFRQFVTDWLERRGFSQARLAEATEISQSLVSKHLASDERRRVRPSPENLEKYAPVLDVKYEELLRMCGYLPGQPKLAATDNIEADVRARTAELLSAVRGTPAVFWPTILKALDGVRDMAESLTLLEGATTEDRASKQPQDRASDKRHIGGPTRRQRPIKPRHPALAGVT